MIDHVGRLQALRDRGDFDRLSGRAAAGEHQHLALRDQLLGDGRRERILRLVILDDDFEFAAVDAALCVDFFHGHRIGLLEFVAERSVWTRHRLRRADLERLLRKRAGRQRQ